MIKVGGIRKMMVLRQAVFLVASQLINDGSTIKSHSTLLQRPHCQISLYYYTIPPATQARVTVDVMGDRSGLTCRLGGDRRVTISRFPYPVIPPPVRFCSFVSQLPPFIVFLLLSCKSSCLTPYWDSKRECFGLVQNKKLCCKSNHSALSSAIIEAAFLRHKFTPRGKIFITVFCELQS